MKSAVVLLVLYVVGCHGYPNGPPVKAHPDICTTLQPHHGAPRQTSPPPYEIVTPSLCYKEGQAVPVTVRVKPEELPYKYFQGLFILARNDTTKLSWSSGNFSTSDDTLQRLDCHGRRDSAVGHNQKAHWTCKTFMWWPPTNLRANINFHGTIVKNKATYWIGVGSSTLRYKSECMYPSMPMEGMCGAWGAFPEVSGCGAMTSHVITVVMALLFVSIFQFLLS